MAEPGKPESPESAVLPKIRQDLKLYPGPKHRDGSPGWRILDPVRNRFFEIGWLEFQLLSHWSEDDTVEELIDLVSQDSSVQPTVKEVAGFVAFLDNNQLTVAKDKASLGRLRGTLARSVKPWYETLFHNYLFFRIPLVKPDRFLEKTLPLVAFFYTYWFAALVIGVFVLDLYLVSREFDEVRRTFAYFFNLQGGIYFLIAASASKVIHELGHAYTARRYGVRVPAMGLAFLVMWPVLYTDTSESWKLADNKKLFAIASAGIVSELSLACFATLFWVLSPEGPSKNIFFILATTTWVMTLAINASPFMRFDGYYLLSDFLDFPNLHERSSACARWWIRRRFFNLRQPVPEPTFTANQRRSLVTFALVTWFYRLTVFIGIALIVYHTFYKPLGILLMVLEIAWFVVKPVATEFRYLYAQKGAVRLAWHAFAIAIAALFALVWAMPITSQVSAPGVLIAVKEQSVFVPTPARIVAVEVQAMQAVDPGAVLVRLESPELDVREAVARSKLATSRTEYLRGVATSRRQEQTEVLASQVYEADASLRAVLEEKANLVVRANISGTVRDIPPDLVPGRWINSRELMMRVVLDKSTLIEAYLDDSQVRSVALGQSVKFYPTMAGVPVMSGEVISIDKTGVKQITRPLLVGPYGGDVPAAFDKKGGAVARDATYRVVIQPDDYLQDVTSVARGTVRIHTDIFLVAENFLYRALSILIRESGL